MEWFSLVLWYNNHFRLFNSKSCFYIYIKYIGFGWVGFYVISIILDYLMPNPFYTHIYIYIYIYIYIFNSWNIVCSPGFHGVFCKTTIIRQLRWNELKIEKTRKNTDKKPLGFRLCVVVSV